LIREVKEETGLPATLLPTHRIRIRDALSARRTPFIR
jgi:8-oxo-dGTP pyrophosphatase MutT (NUDIX family)